jgi:hypothetical protein
MITVHLNENDDLIVTEEILPGDVYSDLCCKGYDFTIAVVIISAWGHCNNPKHRCSDHAESETCTYCNVNNFEMEDIARFVMGERRKENEHALL